MEGIDSFQTQVAVAGYAPYFANLQPEQFRSEIEARWKAVDNLRISLVESVEEGLLSPLDAWQGIGALSACVIPVLFGHGTINARPMLGFDMSQLDDLTRSLTERASARH